MPAGAPPEPQPATGAGRAKRGPSSWRAPERRNDRAPAGRAVSRSNDGRSLTRRALEQRHRLRREPLAPAREAEEVGRRRPHADPVGAHPERRREPIAHRGSVRRDARLLADQHAVGVDELVAGLPHLPVGLAEQLQRVRSAVALVVGREERPDVREPRCAEQGVGERVGDHVAVGVPGEPARMVDRDPAEHERHARLEGVRVDPRPMRRSLIASEASACGTDGEVVEAEGGLGWRPLQTAPRAAADVNRDETRGGGGQHVVVDPVADVGDLARQAAGQLDDRRKKRGSGLRTPRLSDDEITSAGSAASRAHCSSAAVWLPTIPTRSPSARTSSRHAIASG